MRVCSFKKILILFYFNNAHKRNYSCLFFYNHKKRPSFMIVTLSIIITITSIFLFFFVLDFFFFFTFGLLPGVRGLRGDFGSGVILILHINNNFLICFFVAFRPIVAYNKIYNMTRTIARSKRICFVL